MRILLVTPYFPPQNAVASLRVHAFAKCWSEASENVTVLTTVKRADQQGLDLPQNTFQVVELPFAAPRALEWLRSRHRPVESSPRPKVIDPVSSSPSLVRRWKERTGIFSSVRMPDLTDWWVKPALRWCRSHPGGWDCVVSSSGPYTAHLVAMNLKKNGLAGRWIADFRDLWTGNHLHCGLFPFTLRERMLESQCLRTADMITTVSEGLATSLRRRTRRPVEIIFNGFDEEALNAASPEPIFPNDGCVRIVYTGTLYPHGQDPQPLLRAMKSLQREAPDAASRIRLVIAGRGTEHWRTLADRSGVAGMIDLRGMVSRDEALRMQRDADALLLLDWNDSAQGVLTSKVFEYLNATAPILIISPQQESELIRLVNRSWRGFEAGTNEARILESLRALLDPPATPTTQPDREFIATLSRERQSMRMLELIRSITSGS